MLLRLCSVRFSYCCCCCCIDDYVNPWSTHAYVYIYLCFMHRKSTVKASLILWFHPSKQVLIESHMSYNLLNTRLDFEEAEKNMNEKKQRSTSNNNNNILCVHQNTARKKTKGMQQTAYRERYGKHKVSP